MEDAGALILIDCSMGPAEKFTTMLDPLMLTFWVAGWNTTPFFAGVIV